MPDDRPPRPALFRDRTIRSFVPNRALEAAQGFMHTEASGGVLLLMAAAAALVWVNSPLDQSYADLWHTQITIDLGIFRVDEDLGHFVNDGLMAVFFFVVGLEIKREIVRGELSDRRRATLPAAAALGGMVVPALLFTLLNAGGNGARGWGIPMATDIAFAVGVLSLLGGRVPFGVKIFLLALAIVDDLGAILVIALFYTEDLALGSLGLAFGLFAMVWALNALGVRSLLVYVVLGSLLWVAMLESGVHATVAGVALGLITPSRAWFDPSKYADTVQALVGHFRDARSREDLGDQEALLGEIETVTQGSEAPLERFERQLHPWVSYVIMPVFALANAGVVLGGDAISDAASSPVTHGIVLGLLLGKLAGILVFSFIAVRLGLSTLPTGANWGHIAGVSILGGIGFTVSLFITGLAFSDEALVSEAKIGIFCASIVAGVVGFAVLWATSKPKAAPDAAA